MLWLLRTKLLTGKGATWLRFIRSGIKLSGCGTGFALCLREGFEKAVDFIGLRELPWPAFALAIIISILFTIHSAIEAFEFYKEAREFGHICTEEALQAVTVRVVALTAAILVEYLLLKALFGPEIF